MDPRPAFDDPTIRDACLLLRRIVREWLVHDENRGGPRISSQAFTNERLSVNVGDDLIAEGFHVEAVLERYPGEGLAAITAQLAREKNQAVCRDPAPPELCHGLVIGKKTSSTCKAFARQATENLIRTPQ